ncbi:MAG: HAMP domain-containing protein [Deltaproteobacteria bacterium]|nr:HAMP domain-containing protein [Deltaproteobacteria bacterium]
MKEQALEDVKNTIPRFRWGLRTKLNIYLTLIIIITIPIFEIIALKLHESSFIIHTIHAVVTILLVIVLINISFSRLILEPLNNLIGAMREMEEGKLVTSLYLGPVKDDEIGWLTKRFFQMGKKIQENIIELVRSEKRESARAIAHRLERELHEPVLSIEKNIEILRTLIPEAHLNPHLVLGEIAKDVSSIRKFSNDISSMFSV